VSWVVERVRQRWRLDVRVAEPAEGVEAPELRLDATAARERLQWRPQMDAEAALAATVSWYDDVRAGADPRAVTLKQIEERA
jgi:nucleoside-diphosphate-sugar epimerase